MTTITEMSPTARAYWFCVIASGACCFLFSMLSWSTPQDSVVRLSGSFLVFGETQYGQDRPVPADHRLTARAVPRSFDVPLRITSQVRPFQFGRIVSKSKLHARKPGADPSDLLR